MRRLVDCTMRCAIVGSGVAALAAYTTLRYGRIAPEEITVFGTDDDPTARWRERAAAIRQRRMRSESDGHLAPSSFPGLAVREAARRVSLGPLLASAADRYHPSVDDFLAHADEVRGRSGWEASFVARRIERIRAVDAGFELDGEGPFTHVLVATGHPGLARIPGAVHAYEPHDYAARVAIVGAGMAAATEWLNALAAGSEVISVRRREPLRRTLNVPRPYFSKRGLASFHRLADGDRAAKLHELATPSFPPGPEWDEPLVRATSEGRLTIVGGGSEEAQTSTAGLQVICATGFLKGYRHDPLLRDLVDSHDLETHDRWIVLDRDSTIPSLTDNNRTLALAGVAAQWTFPAADTIAGGKYAARAFLRRCRTR
jgi:cation diffusion facilitator CzcD-associated flavoprotein CzcO